MMAVHDFQVEQIHPLTDRVVQIYLKCEQAFSYQAGQYIEIMLDDLAIPYSIANAPLGGKQIELHISHCADNPMASRVLAHIRRAGVLKIKGPQGNVVYSPQQTYPSLYIAGGTGFAPMKAMIEQALMHEGTQSMHLFWGARYINDLYMAELAEHWGSHVEHFHYTPVLSNASKDWQGEVGSLRQAVIRHYPDLSQHQAYIAGPFDMVFAARDTFVAAGLPITRIFSDAFAFEAR